MKVLKACLLAVLTMFVLLGVCLLFAVALLYYTPLIIILLIFVTLSAYFYNKML